jgi:hypothetical protein
MRREAFCPFIVELRLGTQILIDADSEILFPLRRPELAIAFTTDGVMHEFETSCDRAAH